MAKVRRIWKFLVITTAYLYIPIIVTLSFDGNASRYADVPVDVRNGDIEGRKVNIIYNNAVQAVSLDDFVAMSVAREYNADKDSGDQKEMIKALAVIIRSDVVCQMNKRSETDSDRLENGFMTRSQMKSRWGDKWQDIFSQIQAWVAETENSVITYRDNYIRAMYTRVSPGRTMSGARLIGEEYAYLAEVECPRDTESPEYSVAEEYDKARLISAVRDWKKKTGMDCGIDESNPANDIQITAKTDDGYITGVQVGDVCMSGEEFASMMGLNSAYLSFEYKKDSLKITSRGVGMGFGMSMYTANIMAVEGVGYKEIIKHFYPECIITGL